MDRLQLAGGVELDEGRQLPLVEEGHRPQAQRHAARGQGQEADQAEDHQAEVRRAAPRPPLARLRGGRLRLEFGRRRKQRELGCGNFGLLPGDGGPGRTTPSRPMHAGRRLTSPVRLGLVGSKGDGGAEPVVGSAELVLCRVKARSGRLGQGSRDVVTGRIRRRGGRWRWSSGYGAGGRPRQGVCLLRCRLCGDCWVICATGVHALHGDAVRSSARTKCSFGSRCQLQPSEACDTDVWSLPPRSRSVLKFRRFLHLTATLSPAEVRHDKVGASVLVICPRIRKPARHSKD